CYSVLTKCTCSSTYSRYCAHLGKNCRKCTRQHFKWACCTNSSWLCEVYHLCSSSIYGANSIGYCNFHCSLCFHTDSRCTCTRIRLSNWFSWKRIRTELFAYMEKNSQRNICINSIKL